MISNYYKEDKEGNQKFQRLEIIQNKIGRIEWKPDLLDLRRLKVIRD